MDELRQFSDYIGGITDSVGFVILLVTLYRFSAKKMRKILKGIRSRSWKARNLKCRTKRRRTSR